MTDLEELLSYVREISELMDKDYDESTPPGSRFLLPLFESFFSLLLLLLGPRGVEGDLGVGGEANPIDL